MRTVSILSDVTAKECRAKVKQYLRNLRYYRVAVSNAPKEDADDVDELRHRVSRIDNALSNLPDDEKEAVMAFYVFGERCEKIADRMHISYATCGRKMRRGITGLSIMLFGKKAE